MPSRRSAVAFRHALCSTDNDCGQRTRLSGGRRRYSHQRSWLGGLNILAVRLGTRIIESDHPDNDQCAPKNCRIINCKHVTFTRVTERWSFADRIDNPVNIEELVGWSKASWTRETASGPKGSSFFTADFFNVIFTLAVVRAPPVILHCHPRGSP